MFQSLGIPHGRLTQQFLKLPPVVERPPYVRHEFVGNIDGESFPFHPHIQKMTGVFLPSQAGLAVFTDAGTPTQTERAHSGGPETRSMTPEPLLDISNGNVSDIRVPSGHPLLCDAAVEAVKQWKYSPTLLNGNPIAVKATVQNS
jgi:hypothetical protein